MQPFILYCRSRWTKTTLRRRKSFNGTEFQWTTSRQATYILGCMCSCDCVRRNTVHDFNWSRWTKNPLWFSLRSYGRWIQLDTHHCDKERNRNSISMHRVSTETPCAAHQTIKCPTPAVNSFRRDARRSFIDVNRIFDRNSAINELTYRQETVWNDAWNYKFISLHSWRASIWLV